MATPVPSRPPLQGSNVCSLVLSPGTCSVRSLGLRTCAEPTIVLKPNTKKKKK